MPSLLHHLQHPSKCLEVTLFASLEGVLVEEWDDAFIEIPTIANPEGPTIAVIRSHHSASEELSDASEQLHIAFVLHDGEFRKYLNAASHAAVARDRHMEAAFTIHETCDPLWIEFHWKILDVKSLRVPSAKRAFPADCPHVRLILTARLGAGEYRTAVRGVSRIWSSFTKASEILTLGPL